MSVATGSHPVLPALSPSPPLGGPGDLLSPLGQAPAQTSGVGRQHQDSGLLRGDRASGMGTMWWEGTLYQGKQVALEGPGLGSKDAGQTSGPRSLSAP